MDKAEKVFEKYSGFGTKLMSTIKNIMGVSSKAGATSGKYVKMKMPDYIGKSKAELIKSRYPGGPSQVHLEKEYMARSNTRGKLPVSPPDREKLLRDLAAERFKRSMGV